MNKGTHVVNQMTQSISVIIPCFNAESWVGRAIESVLIQKELNLEIIVIDDGSTDNSLVEIRDYGCSIQWESNEKKGACAARNRGLELSMGDYIMFLDADDFLKPGCLCALLATLQSEDADLAFGETVEVHPSGANDARKRPRTSQAEDLIIDWLRGAYVPPCGILWRRESLPDGGWDETLQKNQDGDLILRAVIAGAKPATSLEARAVYWQHSGTHRISNTVSARKLMDAFRVITRAQRSMEEVGMVTARMSHALSYATHNLERMAARNGFLDTLNFMTAHRRLSGWPAYQGKASHVVSSMLLGLERKERLASRLQRNRIAPS